MPSLIVATVQAHLATIALTHSIILIAGWPINSSMSAAVAFRLLAREAAIQTNFVSLKVKMQAVIFYVWTKGTIEDHLGGIPKNESRWANFNARLYTEDLNVFIPSDHTEITDLVTWLIS